MLVDALVLPPRAADLLRVMPFKAPPDMSRFLLSPMPGLLADVSVKPGQKVLAGETAGRDRGHEDGEHPDRGARTAPWSNCWPSKGDSLAVDQPILSFA